MTYYLVCWVIGTTITLAAVIGLASWRNKQQDRMTVYWCDRHKEQSQR